MTDSRQTAAIGAPPADLSGFPRWRLRPSIGLRRAHGVRRSPWWFSHDLSGRFDLCPPDGTCYLATDVATALRERFGHELVQQGVMPFETAAATAVSTLQVPTARWVANVCHDDAADYGLTRELGTCPSYETPQAWAAAFRAGMFSGMRYQTRFTTGPRPNAIAIFDSAGRHDWPQDPAPLNGVNACAHAGISVLHRPSRKELRIVTPYSSL